MTQAWLIFTATQKNGVQALNNQTAAVMPRLIDNLLANNIGEGTLVGKYVAPARLLNDPSYTEFVDFCSAFPIRTIDSDVLFLPQVLDV